LTRVTASVATYPPRGTARQSVDALSRKQRTAAAPLYAKLFESGSVVPLEKQFEGMFRETSAAQADAQREVAQE
jgi:hypothetical protein